MMLFNKKLTAAEAQACGLVTAVLPPENFESEIEQLVSKMALLPKKVRKQLFVHIVACKCWILFFSETAKCFAIALQSPSKKNLVCDIFHMCKVMEYFVDELKFQFNVCKNM